MSSYSSEDICCERESLIPSVFPLDNMGKELFWHQERFGGVKGKAGGSVPEAGVTLTVIGFVGGRRSQVIMNILDKNPWELLDIYALRDIMGVGDEDLILKYRWEGA